MAVAVVGSLALFAWRAPTMKSEGVFQPVSREGALVYNNLVLAVSCAVVLVGTFAPLFREAVDGEKISVGAPFFDLAFTPFMVILFLGLPVGSILAWKRADLGAALARLWWAGAAALAIGGIAWGMQTGTALLAPVGLALAAWLILGVIAELVERGAFARVGFAQGMRRLVNLPRADWGKSLAHGGLGLMVMGIAVISAWETEDIRVASPGDVIAVGGYDLHFDGVERVPAGAPFAVAGCNFVGETMTKGGEPRNFNATLGRFRLMDGDELVARMCPEKRVYPVTSQPTTEASIDHTFLRDIYVALGDQQEEGTGWTVRSYYKPMAIWIWLGPVVMGLGGIVSLSDRRYRVGAVRRRAGAGTSVPAE